MHPGIQSWKNLVTYAFNAFSTPLLLRTWFAPWKMDREMSKDYTILERATFHIMIRVIGFVARTVLIIIGLLCTLFAITTFPIFLVLPVKISAESLQDWPSYGASLSYGETYTLNAHSRDLASTANERMYGKDKALRMIARGLAKDENPNVLLVGDTGTGKSTLIRNLGRLGQSGLSAFGLHHHRVVELFVENLSEADFDTCLAEAAKAGNVILVVENIHAYEHLYDRMLPYLSGTELAIIGTTDFAHYDQVLKNHPEFLSKFEKVDLLGTNAEETLAILRDTARAEGMSVDVLALTEIVRLGERLVGNEREPARSLHILEELKTMRKKITILDVQQVISDKTNIPIGAIGTDERKVLAELEGTMRKKIVGQDEAVEEVSEALRRLRTGIADHNKPAGSFLFLGPTGVGKTYTAKVLAESYFGRKDAMIRFDMSEFSLPDSVTTFTDRLASVIEEAPLSLVFFDELEKSHVAIRNLFLQILDEGRLTRQSGREASFKEAIVIATSNAGSAEIMQNPAIEKKALIDTIIEKNIFAPEFLNRFSGIILFKPLTQGEAKRVASLMLYEFAERLKADKNITLEITSALVDKVAAAGFDPQFGARPIKRAIEQLVENKVAEYIMAGNTGGTLTLA